MNLTLSNDLEELKAAFTDPAQIEILSRNAAETFSLLGDAFGQLHAAARKMENLNSQLEWNLAALREREAKQEQMETEAILEAASAPDSNILFLQFDRPVFCGDRA